LRTIPAARLGRMLLYWLRPHGRAIRLAGCLLSVGIAAGLAGAIAQGTVIWIANGVLLAYLLLAPRRLWPAYLCAGFLGHVIATSFTYAPWQVNLVYTLLDVFEAFLAAVLLRRRSAQLPRFTRGQYLLRFLAFAVLAAPIATAAIAALIEVLWHRVAFSQTLLQWVATDSLGICVVVPACVPILQSRIPSTFRTGRNWAYLIPIAATSVLLFSQSKVPVPFVLYPLLVLVLLRLGLGWASLTTLFVSGVASFFTVRGQGPFAASGSVTPRESAILLQLFIASAIVLLYSVSVVLERLRAAERRHQRISAVHKLVSENSRDIILIADFDGLPTYISSAVGAITGWNPEETMHRGFAEVVHPDDLAKVQDAVRTLREGAETATIEYRIGKRRGGYVWVEGRLRSLRDPATGVSTGFLQLVSDISERKHAELARQLQLSVINAIHDVSLDGILVVDDKQRVVSCNQRFADVWSLSLPQNLPGYLDENSRFSYKPLLSQALENVKDPAAFSQHVSDFYSNPDAQDHCEFDLKNGRTIERYTTGLHGNAGEHLGRVWFFRDVSEHILAEHRLQEAYRALETLAVTDALTGVANRRQFEQSLANEWRRGLRDRKPLSLLLIDADLFKSYNDSFGHPRGDNCLKQIAEAAQDVVARPGDLVARFGGEEFAVILPNTPNSGAMKMAFDICAMMRNRQLKHPGNPAGIVTVSVGCATLVPQLGQHAATLVECADQALYDAKRAGRNCACNYQSEVEVAKPVNLIAV